MKIRFTGVLAALMLGLAGCGLTAAPTAASIPPPHHLQSFLPHAVPVTGHTYFPKLATEVVWGEQPPAAVRPLWVALLQVRHQHWVTVYRHRWANAVSLFKVTQRRNPHASESDLVLLLGAGGNQGFTTDANFVVTPTRATLATHPSGLGGLVSAGKTQFRETFTTAVDLFTWRHQRLVVTKEGPLATIPPHAATRSVYITASQPTPTIEGSPTIHAQPGQAVAILPTTPYTMTAFEQARLGLFGAFSSWTAADNANIDNADTIQGLWTRFQQPGVYYLDVVTNPYGQTSPFQILTVVVGNVPVPPPPAATVTFGTGFNDKAFSLTGTGTTFAPTATVYWLLNDPVAFNTTTLQVQLYQQQGASQQLVNSSPFTVNPQDGEEEDTLNFLGAGTYQLVCVIGNKVLATGTFTIQ